MNEGQRSPLLVEVILAGAQMISGVTDLVAERRRLVDVLNGPEEIFELESVSLAATPGAQPRRFESLAIEKRSILVAVPRETQAQSRRRAVLTSILGRLATVPVPLILLVPPLTVEGVAHVPPGSGKIRADPEMFAHFFPLTGARIVLPDGSSLEELAVALVNRNAVAAMSLRDGAAAHATRMHAAAAPQSGPPAQRDEEDEQVPWVKVVRPTKPRLSA